MAKITFADKVKIKDIPVAEINKFTDANANEIKTVVNGLDDSVIATETRLYYLETGQGNIIDASAIWTSGLSFDVTANSFPVLDAYYSATGAIVTLNTAHATLGRFDFIVAHTNGTVGKLTGVPLATPADPDDYDPSTMYLIKRVLVPAAATVPFGVSKTLVFNEGVGTPTEFAFSTNSAGRIAVTTTAFHLDLKAIEATNPLITDIFDLTYSSVLSTTNIGVITFWLKLKAVFGNNSIIISFANAGVSVGAKYWFKNGQNGFDANNLNWQKITIDSSKLGLPVADFTSIRIRPYKAFAGYFIDEVYFNVGSEITVDQPYELISNKKLDIEANKLSDVFYAPIKPIVDWVTSLFLKGSGTQNYLPKFGVGGKVVGNSQIFDNGSSINIGESIGNGKFNVRGFGTTSSTYSFEASNGIGGTKLIIRDDGWFAVYGADSTESFVLSEYGNSKTKGSVQVGDNTAIASAALVGATRYREDANNSYEDVCMKTGASTYAWINVVTNTW